MDHQLSYFANVTGYALTGFNRKQLALDLEAFEGKRVEIIIRKAKKSRSTPQNAYYHGVVIPSIRFGLKETQGFLPTAAETHEWLKSKFNCKELVNHETGDYQTFPQSTTILSTIEFSDYVDRCRAFAQEFLNVTIPDPEKQATIFY